MNRPEVNAQPNLLSSRSDAGPQLWIIRAGKDQKAFVARALQLLENFDAWQNGSEVTAESVTELELEAASLGFFEVRSALQAVSHVLVAFTARAFQHPALLAALPPLPASASRPLSALLLRVYLTGTDAGGETERGQVQELLDQHLSTLLPSIGYLRSNGN